MRRHTVWILLFLLAAALPAAAAAQLQITARSMNISVGGFFQTQYSKSSVDTPNAVDDFLIRRARILLDLKLGNYLDGRIEPDFGGGGVGVGLADVYFRFLLATEFKLSFGQFKRSFSYFELASDTDLPDIERDARIEGINSCPGVGSVCTLSRLTGQLQFDERDIGLRAEGDVGKKLQYQATFTNGQGRNAADVNDAKSVSGRLTFIPKPNLRISGFAASHDYLTTQTQETRRAGAWGGDLEIGTFRKGFHLIAGVSGGDNWLAGTSADFLASELIATWYFPLEAGHPFAGIEPLIRIDRTQTETAAGVDIDALTLTPGISFYVDGKNWLDFNLDHYDPSPGAGGWSLKGQAYFYF